jgi:hypothetical protein
MRKNGSERRSASTREFIPHPVAQNLFNHTNATGYSGVMTSPFFGQPTAALPGRRIELGARMGF